MNVFTLTFEQLNALLHKSIKKKKSNVDLNVYVSDFFLTWLTQQKKYFYKYIYLDVFIMCFLLNVNLL